EGPAREDDLAGRPHLAAHARVVMGPRMGAVEPLALQVLDPDGPVVSVEEDAGGQRVELEGQAIRVAPRRLEHTLAGPEALMVPGREGHVADPLGAVPHHPPVVGIGLALDEPPDTRAGPSPLLARLLGRPE